MTAATHAAACDATHDPGRRSWVESANDDASDFPIQNLPLGVFRRAGGPGAGGADATDDAPRIGVAIGDAVLDVHACVEARLLDAAGPEGCCALSATTLNPLMGQGPAVWSAVRRAVADLLDADCATLRDDAVRRDRALLAAGDVVMLVPADIGDYTDFYCSIHHATNVGRMFRPDNPLMPNYKHLPVGYHGRASSIGVSPARVRRPKGQTMPADADAPIYGPSRLLDYELEMGFYVGPGNALGEPVAIADAPGQIFGMCIVNDWSARDVQKWEYQPLGPFNAKNFATTVSPWVVTLDALAPFRGPGPERGADDPPVLDYLAPPAGAAGAMSVDVVVEVHLASAAMREQGIAPTRVSRGNFRDMYWTIAQMLVHHSSTGCNMRPGDLIASGTVSGPADDAGGCLLERTWRGERPIALADGTERKFLQDGDEVTISAWCERDGTRRIGFGACTGVVTPASP